MSDSLQLHGLSPVRHLSAWDCTSKNTGVSCHFLLQDVPYPRILHWRCLLHWRWILYWWATGKSLLGTIETENSWTMLTENCLWCPSIGKLDYLSMMKDSLVAQTNAGSSPGLEKSLGEGNDYPIQDSCLENSMDRGARWATACGITKSQTQLKKRIMIRLLCTGLWHCSKSERISLCTPWPA